jgi:NAD(P)-dependent dehydrogenase (short-subunit alcohol dehydrogenase family)
MSLFADRRVLITGSTRGLGHAAAVAFLREGADVILHGRNDAVVREIASTLSSSHPGKVSTLSADLAHRAAQDKLAAAAGDLDVLVNCAGVFEERMLSEASDEHWLTTIEVNLTAPWRLARALLPGLERRQGVIVNVGSDSAMLGYSGSSAYCASKGALVGLTRALATELAPRVRALCICPGPVDTDMMRQTIESQPDPGAARRQWQSYTLLRRFATPAEIAEAIVFAASPACSFQTGSLIVIDGGATAGRKP